MIHLFFVLVKLTQDLGWRTGYPANLKGRIRVPGPVAVGTLVVSRRVTCRTRRAVYRRWGVDLRPSGGQTDSFTRSPLAGSAGDGRDLYQLGTRPAQDDRQYLVCDARRQPLVRVTC